jgi:dipeptidyl-peptidase 4
MLIFLLGLNQTRIMKKHFILIIFTLCVVFGSNSQTKISLEDIWTKGTFSARGVMGFNSLNDGRYYCNLDEEQNLLKYAFATGKVVDTIVKISDIKRANGGLNLSIANFSFSADESKLLIATQTEYIYRHSSQSIYYVYDLQKKTLVNPVKEWVRYATFSPDASKLAFVRDNNLFYYDFRLNQEVRITKDGKVNEIINGATDWVYEEEFAIWQGFSWNEAGDKIAFYRFDESKVPQFEMTMYGSLYPKQEKFKYPKAGEANSLVNIFVYDLKTELITEIETGKETDIYLPRMQWTKNADVLCVQRLNRLQNKLDILLADAMNGKSNVIYSETNKYYIDITDNLTFLNDGWSMVFTSERDGYNHIYLYDMKYKSLRQLTKGAFDIDDFFGVDEKNKLVYFSSSEVNAAERYVYAIGLNGKKKVQISKGKGWHSATFNSDFTYYLDIHSDMNTPPVYTLLNNKGGVVRTLADNAGLREKLKSYDISPAVFGIMKNVIGDNMNYFAIYPSNFDSTKKYPVLMYVYGGPGSQTVMNRWSGGNYFWYQLLAQQGYIVFSVDGRGTGFKGEQYKKCTYLNLGKLEIEDQIYAANQLAKLPFVDANRIGIWGWSFGGYMAGLGISKGNDIFKAAISVAPVTNWRYYDNIYTERFMRTPQENGQNYDDNSPMNHVEKIKGNYLIIHGTADDNVHFQNAVEMVDQMIKKGVKFDSEFYPNKNHGIGGSKVRLHLYERMTRFLLEKL